MAIDASSMFLVLTVNQMFISELFSLFIYRLSGCLITLPETVSSVLVIGLRSDPFQMKALDLSYNPLADIELDFPFQLKLK